MKAKILNLPINKIAAISFTKILVEYQDEKDIKVMEYTLTRKKT